MAEITCPQCRQEPVVIHVTFECPQGHRWTEVVDRPGQYAAAPSEAPAERKGMKMPFGKYKGQFMEDVPVDYFEWCLAKLDDLSPSLRDEMQNQIDLKSGKGVVRRSEGRIEGKTFKY